MKPSLLLRIPARVPDENGVMRNALFILECGHRRNPTGGYEQHCAECAKVPHPRTNPDHGRRAKGASG